MGLGSFISKAVKAAGKIVSPVTKPIGDALEPITNPIDKAIIDPVTKAIINPVVSAVEDAIATIQKIPVLGQIFNIYTGVHIFEGAERILSGERVDRALLKSFKGQMREYTKLAPYAASVVSFVPGVGPGVGAAICAAGALAEGRPLSEVALAAIKGAIPGGAIAAAAFSMAEATAAGKPIEQIAVAGLPIDAKSKQALNTAIALTKDLANGKRLDKALMNRLDDSMKLLPADLKKAVLIGQAVGIAEKLQKDVAKVVGSPEALTALAKLGTAVSQRDKLIGEARNKINNTPQYKSGFDVATGLLNGKNVTQAVMVATRNALGPAAKKGFDAATALQIGRVVDKQVKTTKLGKKPAAKPVAKKAGVMKKKPTVKNAVGYFTTIGLIGAKESQKVGIVKELAKSPETRQGAVDAIKTVANSREASSKQSSSIWEIIKRIFGFGSSPKQLTSGG